MFQSFEPPETGGATAERLGALRAALAALGAQAMIVPRNDAHQSEAIAASEARLGWLTGFTGSAGLAAVTESRAALFVDGRYTLQAAEQVDGQAVEIVATHETKPVDWLAAALSEGARLAYDPWLHAPAEIARLEARLSPLGVRLTPLSANPIDALWEGRPTPPMGAVCLHPEEIAGEPAEAKRRRLGAELAGAGQAAAVLTLPASVAWLLNIRGTDLPHVPVVLAFAILESSGRVQLFLAPDRLPGPVREHLGPEVAVAPPDAFGPALDALSGAKVRVDGESCPVWVVERLKTASAEPVLDTDPCLLPKARKNAAEIAGMTRAHERDGAAMVRFLHWLDAEAEAGTALTEIAIAERLESCRAETGALLDISFDTICGSGPHGAIVHYRVTRASDRTLAPGEILLVDSGGQYRDGTTDITRTLPFGPPLAEAARPYTLVLKGLIAISTARWPAGLTGRDLDPLARAALWRAGLDYDHGTGHGVGAYLDVHEGPAALSRRSGTVALEPGMVLSNEPGYYRTGAFGIRLENLVVVTEPSVPEGGERPMLGVRDLTLCPFDRRLIEAERLTAEERAWLDTYHARVRETLSPTLPEAARAWLAAATAPL